MHNTPAQQRGPRLWLFTGTGEGPPLAAELLLLGWQLRVSVVTAAAARAYRAHPALELRVGRLGGAGRLRRELLEAHHLGVPFRAVLDVTHPFACAIQGELVRGSAAAGVPLLRLERDSSSTPAAGDSGKQHSRVTPLTDLAQLASMPLAGTRLLLAIGSRHLGLALRSSAAAIHHARVLPNPAALRLALAAGLAPERLAPLHPRPCGGLPAGEVEAALLRRWRIETIVARASGPPTEPLWRGLAAAHDCRLLLVSRPRPEAQALSLDRAALLDTLAAWSR
ncbi:MAG: precorrin-6A/cobalt-precorrin-6A reductase [Cyanobacteria bacterium J06638_7]